MTSKMAVDKEKLVRLQEDFTLQKFGSQKGQRQKRDTEFLMKSVEEFGTGYASERIKWEVPESKFCFSNFDYTWLANLFFYRLTINP